ncbi:dual specificity protein phosphatase [Nocardioides sp.]|uniref:protein-tyrosine phosphatase family protein n=1 Tax=Nocardioides sp. TaxID=35761 RepID=UPI002725BB36|nr:dual specificity protein phosphatase [Nocardioides sp.]MDO9456594.1 dual specificity protein phosphatase [Nocardioides sp.]
MSELPSFELANASFVTPRLAVGGDLDQWDDGLAQRQLGELVARGVTHVVDVRIEADDRAWVERLTDRITYLWHGMDDLGQRVPPAWFESGVTWVEEVLEDPDAVVLTHCHMGINRGPSLGYAVLLAQGSDVVDALAAVRAARPIAAVAYAEDALRWWHARSGATASQRRDDRARLKAWRRENPLDVVRIIAQRRRAEGG